MDTRWTLAEDRRSVTVAIAEDEADNTVDLTLDVEAVDRLLSALGMVRAEMDPGVPVTYETEQFEALKSPGCRVTGASDGLVVLHLRDARYGWLHFAWLAEGAAFVGRSLITAADALRSEPGDGPVQH